VARVARAARLYIEALVELALACGAAARGEAK
jgi:hypothetical protein